LEAEILLDWGWRNLSGKFISGFDIDIRFLDVRPDETLGQLEKRIDDGIQPIKEYLEFEPKVSS